MFSVAPGEGDVALKLTPIRVAREAAYSDGKLARSADCQKTATRAADAVPDVTTVVFFLDVVLLDPDDDMIYV